MHNAEFVFVPAGINGMYRGTVMTVPYIMNSKCVKKSPDSEESGDFVVVLLFSA